MSSRELVVLCADAHVRSAMPMQGGGTGNGVARAMRDAPGAQKRILKRVPSGGHAAGDFDWCSTARACGGFRSMSLPPAPASRPDRCRYGVVKRSHRGRVRTLLPTEQGSCNPESQVVLLTTDGVGE